MNRRYFLTGWRDDARRDIPASGADRPLSVGLEPYIPGGSDPWDMERAGHLLRRTTYMPRWSDIESLLALSPSAAVDLLLDTTYTPDAPSIENEVTESLDRLDITLQNQVRGTWDSHKAQFSDWYAQVVVDAPVTIREKMVAFWSGHFTTEFKTEDDVVQAPLLYRQNRLFRGQALGNFRELVKAVTLDGAMLVYLGGDLNNVGAPNENYARELLELYTTGLGQYTEGDVKEAARILTGWRIARFVDKPAPNGMFNTYFDAAAHDVGAKEFMTVSFPARDATTNTEFIVRRDEIHRLIDVIFEQRPQAIARFISRKLYRFFVYSNPTASDESFIEALADLLIQSGWEIRPVMAAMLKSAHFFDNANIGAQIKTPMEFELGLARQLWLRTSYRRDLDELGQTLFDPPNVSGWPGWHDWITTTTFPIRSQIARDAVQSMSEAQLLQLISLIPDGEGNVTKLVDRLAAILLPRPLSEGRRTAFKTRLTGGAPDYEWSSIVSNSPSTAARNLRDLLTTIVELPDMQLC